MKVHTCLLVAAITIASCGETGKKYVAAPPLHPIRSDTLTDRALIAQTGNYVQPALLRSCYPGLDSTVMYFPNTHEESVTDTMVTYFEKQDSFKFYNVGHSLLLSLGVTSPRFSLVGKYKVGDDKRVILARYKLGADVDTLVVTDEEFANHIKIGFDSAVIKAIYYEADYVD